MEFLTDNSDWCWINDSNDWLVDLTKAKGTRGPIGVWSLCGLGSRGLGGLLCCLLDPEHNNKTVRIRHAPSMHSSVSIYNGVLNERRDLNKKSKVQPFAHLQVLFLSIHFFYISRNFGYCILIIVWQQNIVRKILNCLYRYSYRII